MAQPQDASPLSQQPQQQQGHHSPVSSIINSFITASPSSETSAPHRLTDNDLLGMTVPLDRGFDDDTAPSSSDETPLYNVEGEVPDEDNGIYSNAKVRPLIYGYLLKMGRNGKWQKRFFETDGESLSYFKNEKRTKQLATLDLLKVCTCIWQLLVYCKSHSFLALCTFLRLEPSPWMQKILLVAPFLLK